MAKCRHQKQIKFKIIQVNLAAYWRAHATIRMRYLAPKERSRAKSVHNVVA